jgi:hypothetical protein
LIELISSVRKIPPQGGGRFEFPRAGIYPKTSRGRNPKTPFVASFKNIVSEPSKKMFPQTLYGKKNTFLTQKNEKSENFCE